jgi:putative ABC transport system substrate-binding protein
VTNRFLYKRREFLTLLGGAAAWPLAARAQQAAVPVIGFLHPATSESFAPLVAAFREGLHQTGHIEGQNVTIEYRWAEGQYDRLPALAAELVRRQVAVIATPGSTPATLAAKAATSTIPIIFAVGSDPVEFGLVASLSRPGGNLTGMSMLAAEMAAKRLGLLSELLPNATVFAVLVNPASPTAESEMKSLSAAADLLGRTVLFLNASSERDVGAAFSGASQRQVGAVLVLPDAFFISRRAQIVAQAAHKAIPTMYHRREFVVAGGLISYGDSLPGAYRQVGTYTGAILKGAKPTDLPVQQPTKFELVINLKTAKALGLEIPPTLIARADEVIE